MLPRKRYDTNAEALKFCAYRKAWDLLFFGGLSGQIPAFLQRIDSEK